MNLGAVFAVHAHPDDESINNSGLLALAARRSQVTVVTCTRGELGEVIPPDLADLADDTLLFGQYRSAEIAQAMTALAPPGRSQDGPDQVFLDSLPLPGAASGARAFYHDSGMEWVPGHEGVLARGGPDRPSTAFVDVDLDEGATRLAALIRDRRPGLLVSYEPGGGYGHPDHVRAHEVAMRAVELAGDGGFDLDGLSPWSVPQVWWTILPRDVYRATRSDFHRRALAGASPHGPNGNALVPADPQGPEPALVAPESTSVFKLDTSGVLPQRAAALAAHATQIQGVRLFPDADPALTDSDEIVGEYALSNAILQPILRHEFYQEVVRGDSAAGEDGDERPGIAEKALRTEAARALDERRATALPAKTDLSRPKWIVATLLIPALLLGVAAGIYGSLLHRALPFGTLLALASVVIAATLSRTMMGQRGLTAALVGWFAAVLLLATFGPGGDVMIAGDTIGYLWIFGGTVIGLAVAFIPRGWFEGKT